MDADLILFDPRIPYYERSQVGNGTYLGKTCYGEHGSFQLIEDMKHWNKELSNAVKAGKTVFLLLNSKEEFFLDSGTRSYSGTGKNRSTTINVNIGHNYKFLPFDIGVITSANGKHILSSGNSLFQPIFEQFKDNWEYRVYLDNLPQCTTIFTGKDKSKALGAIFKKGAGNFVVLPYLEYDYDKFTEFKENKKYWTEDAIKFGGKLLQRLLEIDIGFTQETTTTPEPDWVKTTKYQSRKEKKLLNEISKREKQIEKIKDDNKELHKLLLEEQLFKGLLYEKGKPLEIAVIKALKKLGYEAENYNDGEIELDQVILSPEKVRYIGECEGKDSKAINITKLRQLIDSLNADFDRDEVEEKAFGIVFGNPERLKPPNKRKLGFTKKCKTGANREKIALIKTVDLFKIILYLAESNNDNFKKKCRDTIHASLGKIVKFPAIPKKKL